jgi:hypothetical protein
MRYAVSMMMLAVAATAHAADALVAPPIAPGPITGAVGGWASYRTSHGGGASAQDVRVALVARSRGATTWEVAMAAPEGRTATVKNVVGRGGGVSARAMKVGDAPAFRLDIPAELARAAFRTVVGGSRDAGEQRVLVPAGTFSCEHVHHEFEPGHGYDLWIAKRVQPTGVVKFEEWTRGGNGLRLVQETWELAATGRGARPVVVGPVREAPPPKRGPR